MLGTLQKTLHKHLIELAWVQSQRQQEKRVQGLLWQDYDAVLVGQLQERELVLVLHRWAMFRRNRTNKLFSGSWSLHGDLAEQRRYR